MDRIYSMKAHRYRLRQCGRSTNTFKMKLSLNPSSFSRLKVETTHSSGTCKIFNYGSTRRHNPEDHNRDLLQGYNTTSFTFKATSSNSRRSYSCSKCNWILSVWNFNTVCSYDFFTTGMTTTYYVTASKLFELLIVNITLTQYKGKAVPQHTYAGDNGERKYSS
jgi:hypothetical protein